MDAEFGDVVVASAEAEAVEMKRSGDSAPVGYEDAYVEHFKMVLQMILYERQDFARLFSHRERAIATTFLHDLPPVAQQLYARMFQRKGQWFKTTSLFRYFVQKNSHVWKKEEVALGRKEEHAEAAAANFEGDDGDDEEDAPAATADSPEAVVPATPEQVNNADVQTVLQALISKGFLLTLPSGSSASGATRTMFFGSASATTPAAKKQQDQELDALTRSLDALQQCASAPELAALQKTLTGSASTKKRPFPGASSSNGMARSPHLSSKMEAFQAIKKTVMSQRRIDGSRIPLAKLMHQIWFESYPLPGKAKTDVMAVQMPDSCRDLFLRMHRLFYFQSSLPFSYPPSSSNASGKSAKEVLEMLMTKIHQEPTQWPGLMVIFNRVAYPSYEINIQHHAFPSPEAYMCFEVASRLHNIMGMFEQHLRIEISEAPEPDLDIQWMMSDTSPKFVAFQKLIETDDDGFEMLPTADETLTNTDAIVDWQMESWVQFRTELANMTTLDEFVQESRRCFQAFLMWTNSYAQTCSSSDTPVFFSKCNAGYHLARVLHHAVSLYEKHRQYQVAILLLNDLLASPFLQRKRGHWWDRLAVNLEHLKCVDQAQDACTNALNDPHVVGADLIALSRRMRRLQKRNPAKATAQAPSQQKARDRDEEDFVSLISDDEDLESSKEDNANQDTAIPGAPLEEDYAYPREYIIGRPLNRATNEKSRFIGYDDEPCNVEQLVLQFYHSQRSPSDNERSKGGWYGVHCEGHVIGNLFGLFMWDILYASVPNVFQTPFQSAPLDFGYADVFYEARAELIEARLKQLQEEWTMAQILDDLATTWIREYGKVSRFVSWPSESYLPLRFFQLVVLACGQERLAKLMRYMLTSKEYHRAQNGLPDLLVVRVEPKSDELSTDLPLNPQGCLDIYTFCNMTYQMNLNPSMEDNNAASNGEQDTKKDKETKAQPDLTDLLNHDDWNIEVKFVEVKGPRDSLSDKQLVWLQVLNEDVGLDALVTHVVEDDQTLQKKLKKPVAKALTKKSASIRNNSESKRKAIKRHKK
ncbi:Fanconi-associated nuclease 1, partial [Globisporangium splendens]